MAERPTGAVTFLFTDVEGSTQAWENNPSGMAADLETHDRILRDTIESHGGFVFATGGDSFSAAFSSPTMALSAAVEAQRGLLESSCGLRVRMGVHSGEAVERDGNYFGPALNRTARLMSIGHGGQILVSEITKGLASDTEFSFVDLGEHRLADLSTPSRVTQLVADGLDDEFPALRSVVATDNLPRLGEVFGRDSDIEKLATLLTGHQLVTLTGAGGIGKTTLATAVAREMTEPFPDGRWLVDLASIPTGSNHTAISGAVAGVDNRFSSIEALAPRQMLMVLDNCEHVLDAARSYAGELIETAPRVTVLATSREALGIRRERVVPVEPLSVEEGSRRASAVDLFIERATEAGVTIDLDVYRNAIASICKEVEGLPLAIELAAARTTVMTPSQILERLADRLATLRGGRGGQGVPEHHRTLEATIAWSYDLLDPDTQKLLRFLSLFEGGFDLEQAEAVGGTDAVDRLSNLVRKSLVDRRGDRFGMLESVRQYATRRLHEIGDDDEARRLHFEFFADWANRIYHRDEFVRATFDELEWMTANLANLRLAAQAGIGYDLTGSAEIGAVLWRHYIDVLFQRWDDHNSYEPLLPHLDDLDPQLQMVVLHGAGTIAFLNGDLDRARRLLEQEYTLYRETGQLSRTGEGGGPFNNLAALRMISGNDRDSGLRLFQEGIEVARKAGTPHHSTSANYAKFVWQHQGTQEALRIIREAREYDHLNTPLQVAIFGLDEAEMVIETGDHSKARTLLNDALAFLRQHEARLDQQAWGLEMLARIEYQEDLDYASALLLEAIELESAYGIKPIWHHAEAVTLAQVLLALNRAQTAQRVLAQYKDTVADEARTGADDPSTFLPMHLQRLAEVEAAVNQKLNGAETDHDDLPLLDAVRQALQGSHNQ